MDPQSILGKRKIGDPSGRGILKKRKLDHKFYTTSIEAAILDGSNDKKKKPKKRRRKINLLACECCRQLHKKCDGIAPQSCSRCLKKKKKCIYKQRKRRGPKSKKRNSNSTMKTNNISLPNQLLTDPSQPPQLQLSHPAHPSHLHAHLHQLQTELQQPQNQSIGDTIPLDVWPPEYVELPPARPLSATLQASQALSNSAAKATLQGFPFFPGPVLFLQQPPPPPPPELQQESVSSSHPNQVHHVLTETWGSLHQWGENF